MIQVNDGTNRSINTSINTIEIIQMIASDWVLPNKNGIVTFSKGDGSYSLLANTIVQVQYKNSNGRIINKSNLETSETLSEIHIHNCDKSLLHRVFILWN